MKALDKKTRILILSFYVLNWGYCTFACINDAAFLHLWCDLSSESRHDSARVHGVVGLGKVIASFLTSVVLGIICLAIYNSDNLLLIELMFLSPERLKVIGRRFKRRQRHYLSLDGRNV